MNHVSDHKVNCNMEDMPTLWGHVMIIWHFKTICPKWLKNFLCVWKNYHKKCLYHFFVNVKKTPSKASQMVPKLHFTKDLQFL